MTLGHLSRFMDRNAMSRILCWAIIPQLKIANGVIGETVQVWLGILPAPRQRLLWAIIPISERVILLNPGLIPGQAAAFPIFPAIPLITPIPLKRLILPQLLYLSLFGQIPILRAALPTANKV